MSDNERKQVVEDKPTMRSMMIMSPGAAPVMPRMTPIANKFSAGPELVANTAQQKQQPTTTGWAVRSLAPLPPIYCLERTHLQIDDSAENVAERISDCLRKESIAAVYHKDENLVDAETVDHIHFSIRLWEGKNGGVLVEVQKVDGCCYSYCQAAKAVLRAAKGIRTPAKRRTFSIPPCVQKISSEESEANTREGLELAEQLLSKQQLDSHVLATKSVMLLSGAPENQNYTARCILSGNFRSKLLSLIEEPIDSVNTHDEIEKEHVAIMRRHAFSILANCLAALERSGELRGFLQQHGDIASKGVLAALVGEVAAAGERPHDACQAANCLRTLLAASEETKRRAADLNAFDTISEARHMGVCRHAALEDACTQLRTLL